MNELPTPTMVQSSEGVEVATYDLGGSGPSLFLCHATGFCGGLWLPLVETLSENFRCLALDFRGHGQTTLPNGVSMEWVGIADDLTATINHYEPDGGVFVAGHSLGGAVLTLAGYRQPGLISRAWAYEPILFEKAEPKTGDSAPDIAKGARRRRSNFASRQEVIDRFSTKVPLSFLAPDALEAYSNHGFADQSDGTVSLRCRPEVEANTFEHHASGAFEAAGRVDFPFLIAASGDGLPPAIATFEAGERYDNLTLVEYPYLNHFGPLQEPTRIARDIVNWFEES